MKVKRLRYNRRRVFIGLFLFLLLIGVTLGFALITTKLSIEGVARVKDARWDIHFDNYNLTPSSVANTVDPTITGTSITFSAKLEEPGDFYGFTIDVENEGTVNAEVSNFTVTPDFSTIDYIDSEITYSNGTAIQSGDVLAAGTTRKIKVNLKYKEGLADNLYPTTDQSITVTLALDYEQYVGEVPTNFEIGDYITMTPTASTYTVLALDSGYGQDQTITPNELTKWRVIGVNQDGSVDAIADTVSSNTIKITDARGYANYVGLLQTIAEQYANTSYTKSTRMFGYDGQTLTIPASTSPCETDECKNTTTYSFEETTTNNYCPSENSAPNPTSGAGEEYLNGVAGDTLYLKDYLLVKNAYADYLTLYADSANYGDRLAFMAPVVNGEISRTVYHNDKTDEDEVSYSGEKYFVASRSYEITWLGCQWMLRFIDIGGGLNWDQERYYWNGWHNGTVEDHIRPIITLKPGIVPESGTGTKADPYGL